MEYIKRAPRRAHSTELRSQVLSECAQPGASVAAVAMAHRLNANLVRKWQKAGAASWAGLVQQPVQIVASHDLTFVRLNVRVQDLTPCFLSP